MQTLSKREKEKPIEDFDDIMRDIRNQFGKR